MTAAPAAAAAAAAAAIFLAKELGYEGTCTSVSAAVDQQQQLTSWAA
jgi:hypothetical protein